MLAGCSPRVVAIWRAFRVPLAAPNLRLGTSLPVAHTNSISSASSRVDVAYSNVRTFMQNSPGGTRQEEPGERFADAPRLPSALLVQFPAWAFARDSCSCPVDNGLKAFLGSAHWFPRDTVGSVML